MCGLLSAMPNDRSPANEGLAAQFEVAGRPQLSGLNTRTVDGGLLASFDGGRSGRATKLPPQFGQRPPSRLSTQSRQNVHSNEQIIASVADGGKSLLQHSQLGRSSSIRAPYSRHRVLARSLIRREWTVQDAADWPHLRESLRACRLAAVCRCVQFLIMVVDRKGRSRSRLRR
jgi:hypothetical protein